MSVQELRKQLIKQYQYNAEDLPGVRALNNIVNEMKYTVRTVKKTKPMNKVPETELIFENLTRVHKNAFEDDNVVRLSIDTKDRVKIGNFSRGGSSRVKVEAYDHDFGDEYITPFGVNNGSENNSSRTQFIKRMVQFSIDHDTEIILAYYPSYHSKYNPIERVWGVLEQHWNGSLKISLMICVYQANPKPGIKIFWINSMFAQYRKLLFR
jgi:hypothetical protein